MEVLAAIHHVPGVGVAGVKAPPTLECVGVVFVGEVERVTPTPVEQLVVVADRARGIDNVAPGLAVDGVVQPLTVSLQERISLIGAETRVVPTLDGCQRGGGEHRHQQRYQRQNDDYSLRIFSALPFLHHLLERPPYQPLSLCSFPLLLPFAVLVPTLTGERLLSVTNELPYQISQNTPSEQLGNFEDCTWTPVSRLLEVWCRLERYELPGKRIAPV